jgi:hypothetical protein
MLRTKHQPFIGELTAGKSTVVYLCTDYVEWLVYFVNVLVLTFLSLIGYAFLYTLFLSETSHATKYCNWQIAGATPPV